MRLMMPFARRISYGHATATGGSTTTLIDTVNLKQPLNYWVGQWLFLTTADVTRRIIGFNPLVTTLSLEYALAAAIINGTDYEIHSVFNALEIHEAINQSINASFPLFFETVEDDSLVICENTMEYSLATIVPSVGIVHGVALERPITRIYAIVESYEEGEPATVTFQGDNSTADVETGWRLSFYDGTGKGHEFAVLSAGSNTVTIAPPSIVPVNGTKAMLWDPNDQQLDWYHMKHVHFDSKEWPTNLRLYTPIYAYRGSRLRIKYSTMPQALTIDASTTVVPQEYIVPKAVSLLCKTRVGDNRVDRQRYAAMAEEYEKEAENYKKMNRFLLPDTELWMEGSDLPDQYVQDPQGDPLGWR